MATNNAEKATFDASSTKEAFFQKNKKIISGVIIAVIVVVAGWICFDQAVLAPRAEKASTALARGQEYFVAEQFDKALNGDGTGYAGFKSIANDYSSTDAGNLANLYAGLCYANLGKWEEAVKSLEAFSPKGDALVSPAAVQALGNAYAHIKQYDKAISKLKDAASKADSKAKDGVNNSVSPTFLLQAAQLLEDQGKADEANKIYTEIKEKYTTSALVQSNEIEKYIQRTAK